MSGVKKELKNTKAFGFERFVINPKRNARNQTGAFWVAVAVVDCVAGVVGAEGVEPAGIGKSVTLDSGEELLTVVACTAAPCVAARRAERTPLIASSPSTIRTEDPSTGNMTDNAGMAVNNAVMPASDSIDQVATPMVAPVAVAKPAR